MMQKVKFDNKSKKKYKIVYLYSNTNFLSFLLMNLLVKKIRNPYFILVLILIF